VHVPDYPNIAVQFGDGNSNNSVFGADGESSFHSKLFGITANHQLAGFNLNGGFNHNTSNSLFPEFLTGQPAANSETSSNSYNFNVSHLLPMHGSISAAAGRSVVHSESGGDKFNANIDTVSSGVNFAPIRRLDVGASTEYTDNLDGMLYQSLITGGTVLPSSLLSTSTHSLDVNGHASYSLPSAHLLFMATADRRSQSVLGSSISADSLNEMVNYGNDWLGGFLNASMSISETSVSFDHGTKTLGLMDMVSYSRKIQNWNLNGSFNYSRNTQTVLVGYTTSGYGYGAGIGRKLSTYSYFSVNTSGMKSVFNNVAGSGNFSQSYAASYSMKLFAVNGSYNRANGTSILTSEGLTPVNNPPTSAVPLQVLVFNGTSYSFGASTTPMRGLILSGTYSHSISHSLGGTTTSLNTNAQLNTMLQYKVRQLWITGGYLKLQQGFTITGQPAASDSAFYIGVSRWFKFF
jgi:hypothetical protein